jgi:CDP-glucose 4,6-dehydratase
MKCFNGVYSGRRVLVTGHTGFKGSWLTLWLTELGANIAGIALNPGSQPNHWDLLDLSIEDHRIDLRSLEEVLEAVNEFRPEIVFHLAAQSLVRRSYRDPVDTWSTNIMGTVNLLEACRLAPSVQAIVVITTDKCYENKEWNWGYREIDSLGGHDPYSASKAATEFVAASYRTAFFTSSFPNQVPLLATARAGNVIGGGDWAEDRLIPDVVRAIYSNKPALIRSPSSTRPWQHVLESLAGYLLLGQGLFEKKQRFAGSWNFGPNWDDSRKVTEVISEFYKYFPNSKYQVSQSNDARSHETELLYLDSTKAKRQLGWKPVWDFQKTLNMTANWYKVFGSYVSTVRTSGKIRNLTSAQITEYVEDSSQMKCTWTQ